MFATGSPDAGVSAALGCLALLLNPSGAFAQAAVPADGPDIVVEAPRAVPLSGQRNPYTGASTLVVTLRIPALYGDLDLASPVDAARLMKRLDRVAHDACAQLDRLYPLAPDPQCADRAVAGATATATALIEQARDRR